MLKHHYDVLKYIHEHEPISKADLLKKFPDFEDCLTDIYSHLDVDDENQLVEKALETGLTNKACEVCKTVSEISEYKELHGEEYQHDYDNSIVFYSVKTSFLECLEQKQKERKNLSISRLKSVITYILGIISAVIIAYIIYYFGW